MFKTGLRARIKLAEERAEKVSLLPYHEGGKSKCEQMGRVYKLSETAAPGEEHIKKLKEIIEEAGIKASIGS